MLPSSRAIPQSATHDPAPGGQPPPGAAPGSEVTASQPVGDVGCPGELTLRPSRGWQRCAGAGCDHDELERMRGELCSRQAELDDLAQQLAGRRREVDSDTAAREVADADRARRDRHYLEAQRLESLGALAGGLAHQFNNLLTVISGHAGLAAADAPAGSNQAHSLEEVRSAATRAAVLCRQMLDAAGHSVAARRPLHPESLCEDALSRTRGAAGARCRIEYLPALLPLPHVRGVAAQLQQAISAVLQNAFDAVGERVGVVRIALHDQFVDGIKAATLTTPLRSGRHVCVEVRDDGVGIAPETLGRIFEPFFSTKGLGRGLGLAAAAGILRAHGGAIAVESRPGAGSTFRIFLPALETSAAGN